MPSSARTPAFGLAIVPKTERAPKQRGDRPGHDGGPPLVLAKVHGSPRSGLTSEVMALLRANPGRWFTLRDVLACLSAGADKAEVQSILHKAVTKKGCAVKKLTDRAAYPKNVRLLVACYRWKSPGD